MAWLHCDCVDEYLMSLSDLLCPRQRWRGSIATVFLAFLSGTRKLSTSEMAWLHCDSYFQN